MALHNIAVQARLDTDSGRPVDVCINNLSFLWDDAEVGYTTPALMGAQLKARLDAFYLQFDGALSAELAGTGEYRVYDRGETPPRVPIYTAAMVVITPGPDALPNELAVVLSFQGPKISGLSQARRRGRIFIGPLAAATLSPGTGDVQVLAGTRNSICTAATALAAASNQGLAWQVFSEVVGVGCTVVDGWVDDAFDIQRSRGHQATTRQLWT